MPRYEFEKPEGYHPVNSHIKENGKSNGTVHLKSPFGLRFCGKRNPVFCVICVSMILNLALIIILFILLVRARDPSPALPTCPVVSCPNGWVEYLGKCYHFSTAEGNWMSSKRHCSSLNAALAVIDSQEEMDFMMRYKGFRDHWIGLQRINQHWKWINGTIFNGGFEIPGGEDCGVMNQQGIASSSCSREEFWICSKPILK